MYLREHNIKYCPEGDHLFLVGEFHHNPSAPDGLSKYCKKCSKEVSIRGRYYKEENPDDPRDEVYYEKNGRWKDQIVCSMSFIYVNDIRHKWCKREKHWRPEYEFIQKGHFPNQCKECRSKSRTERGKRESHLKVYGITKGDYSQMYIDQKGLCAICKVSFSKMKSIDINVDHCHSTGRVRGILCRNCNSLLGFAKDNIDNLYGAIEYLEG